MLKAMKRATLCMTRQCWEQGVLAQAFMELSDYNTVSLLVRDMVVRQSADGRLCNVENTPAVTDSAFCIPAVYLTAEREKRANWKEAAERNVSYLLLDAPRSADGVLFHISGTQEIWADSAAYVPYALALMGHPDEALHQIRGILGRLYNEETGLYNHMWDEKAGAFKRAKPWGAGNGWILTGLLRLADMLPREYKEDRDEILKTFRSLLCAMLSRMEECGAFHDILDEPDTFLETEVSAMTAYAIYRGVREGVLPDDLLTKAGQIRSYVLSQVTEDGLALNCAGSPDFLRPGTSVEGQAHVMMMEAEAGRAALCGASKIL